MCDSSSATLSGATKQFAVDDKEKSGKEHEDDEEDEDEEEEHGDDDDGVTGPVDQPQQPEMDTQDLSTVSFASLPEWLQDNELIVTGNRPQLYNFCTCLMSVFGIHSETGNIWTHLTG